MSKKLKWEIDDFGRPYQPDKAEANTVPLNNIEDKSIEEQVEKIVDKHYDADWETLDIKEIVKEVSKLIQQHSANRVLNFQEWLRVVKHRPECSNEDYAEQFLKESNEH